MNIKELDIDDSYWELVPLDPNYIPADEAVVNALKILTSVISEREECHQWTSDYIQVIGQFDSDEQEMICPLCGRKKTLSTEDVFSLGEMLSVQPADAIKLTMSCCSSTAMLSSVNFGPCPRLARFGITIMHRSCKLDKTMLRTLGDLLGCHIAQIHIHE
jgi:hypothetical protein